MIQKVRIEPSQEPEFSQPTRQTLLMIIVLISVMFGAYFMFPAVAPIFFAAPYLNGLILGVFVLGVLACFWQVFILVSSVSWIEGFALDRPGHHVAKPPRILAPLAALLRDKRSRRDINSSSSRSILDSVATRLDEARDITRYIVNLLIFLGLLGTFYGLATTVPAVVETIKSLEPKKGQTAVEVFSNLMGGLESQLGGMGTAFASSLLGLAGSLVVGLLELFAGHGQNRFYMELEEWLSSITRIGLNLDSENTSSVEGDQYVKIVNLIDSQMFMFKEALEANQGQLKNTENQMMNLTENINKMIESDLNNRDNSLMDKNREVERLSFYSERQIEIANLIKESLENLGQGDSETRARMRNMDLQLARIFEEISAGRQETLIELRTDISNLSSAIMKLATHSSDRQE